jgi:hypothetical protein
MPRNPVAESHYVAHAVLKIQLEHERTDDVVHTRGEPATRDHGRARRGRLEEDPFARSRTLEEVVEVEIVLALSRNLVEHARSVRNEMREAVPHVRGQTERRLHGAFRRGWDA